MSGFIVKAGDMRNMRLSYYTGRAGIVWLSPHREEAFVYSTAGEAHRKARLFQRQRHEFVFMSERADMSDAHADAAASMSRDMCGE